jgi:hypothetical protein
MISAGDCGYFSRPPLPELRKARKSDGRDSQRGPAIDETAVVTTPSAVLANDDGVCVCR